MLSSLFWWLFSRAAVALDRSIGSHRLPLLPGLVTLIGLRKRLRDRNLYDTRGENLRCTDSLCTGAIREQPVPGQATTESTA
jgi:hypothetical protein